jgi:hypothetical protein
MERKGAAPIGRLEKTRESRARTSPYGRRPMGEKIFPVG